jgi:Cu+-exporting ATPase
MADAAPAAPTRLLPIDGMTCAACATRVERALKQLPGVRDAAVNVATERAEITGTAELPALIGAVRNAGYEVPTTRVTLGVEGMTCASCERRVERALAALPDVVEARASLASEGATLLVLRGFRTEDAAAALRRAGYGISSSAAEAKAAASETPWLFALALLAAPFLVGMLGMALGTGCRRAGRSWRSPRRSRSCSAPASTGLASPRRAPGRATWTCWSRSAPRRPICCRCGCC